ncbi:hypothetical protein, partial [Chryseobacterium sp. CH1]|uniref:hypothetical protein n=1 Tax=Chryseobacterium sp. CH1 TaxID=713551 RepID=UPI0010268A31
VLDEVFLAMVPKNQSTYTINDPNVKRIEVGRYTRKLTDTELDSFKAKIAMRVTIGALCDNYDRLG